MVYIFFGPFILAFYFFVDLLLFFKSTFETHLKPKRGKIDTSKKINLVGYVVMKNTLREVLTEEDAKTAGDVQFVPTSTIVAKLQERMRVSEKIGLIVMGADDMKLR